MAPRKYSATRNKKHANFCINHRNQNKQGKEKRRYQDHINQIAAGDYKSHAKKLHLD